MESFSGRIALRSFLLVICLMRAVLADVSTRENFSSRFPPEYSGESLLVSRSDRALARKRIGKLEQWRPSLRERFQAGTYLPLTVSTIIGELRAHADYIESVNECRRYATTQQCETEKLNAIWVIGRDEGLFDDSVFSILSRATTSIETSSGFVLKPEWDLAIENYDQKRLVVETLGRDETLDTTPSDVRPSHPDYVLWDQDGRRTLRVRLYELYSADEILLLAEWARTLILRMNSSEARVTFQHRDLGSDSIELTFQQKRELAKQWLHHDIGKAVANRQIHRLPEEIDVFAAAIEKGIFRLNGLDSILDLPEFQSRHTKRERNLRIAGGVYRITSTAVLFVPVYGGWLSLLMGLGNSIYENRHSARPHR